MSEPETAAAPAAAPVIDFRVRLPVKDLKRAFGLAAKTIEKRTTIPVLALAKISLDEGLFRVSATDLDNEVVVTICTDAKGAGEVLVPVAEMTKILAVLPRGSDCMIDARGENVVVSCGDSTWNLRCYIPVADYPRFPAVELPIPLQMGADVLRPLIDGTLYAVSREETRYSLNGVSFRAIKQGNQDGMLRVAATDGHRLSVVDVDAPGVSIPNCILPTKAARLLREIVKYDKGHVWFLFSRNGLQLQANTFDVKLRSKMIDGKFPDVEGHVLAKIQPTSRAVVNAATLGAAIRRVAALCEREHRAVRLSFEAVGVDLSMRSADDASALEHVPLIYEGALNTEKSTGPFVVGLNARYAIQTLSRITGDVMLEFQGVGYPIRLSNPADSSAFSVLMPMRVE